MTRHEKIQKMTIEEMAEYFAQIESVCEMCHKPQYCGNGSECSKFIKLGLGEVDDAE